MSIIRFSHKLDGQFVNLVAASNLPIECQLLSYVNKGLTFLQETIGSTPPPQIY